MEKKARKSSGIEGGGVDDLSGGILLMAKWYRRDDAGASSGDAMPESRARKILS